MNAPSNSENFRCVQATSENEYLDEVIQRDMNLCRMRMVLAKTIRHGKE